MPSVECAPRALALAVVAPAADLVPIPDRALIQNSPSERYEQGPHTSPGAAPPRAWQC